MSAADTIDVTIQRLGAAGDGVAQDPSGATRHVADVLPGETVRLPAASSASPEAPLAIVTPSPDRIAPPCPHAPTCGGCALQHWAPDAQAAWKRNRIAGALERHGLMADSAPTAIAPPQIALTQIAPAWVAPENGRRRVKLSARRLKAGLRLGYLERGSDRVVAVETCRILAPPLADALADLRRLAALAAPRARTVALSATATETGLDVAVTEAKPLDPALLATAAALVETAGWARLLWNGEIAAQRLAPEIQVGRARVRLPAGAFLQASAEAEATMAALALDWIGASRRVADLFAGCGAFALRLAERADVLAAEADPAMVEALDAAWRATPDLKRIVAVRRDLFRRPLQGKELAGLDAIVLDPPRAGAEAQTRAIADSAPPTLGRLVMASCDPATFARDAAILVAAGWRLAKITPVDQFRHSAHTELIARFDRGS